MTVGFKKNKDEIEEVGGRGVLRGEDESHLTSWNIVNDLLVQ